MPAEIAHLCYAGVSGATAVALQIVRHGLSGKHAVVLYGVERPCEARRRELEALGCQWSYVPKRAGLDVMGYRRAAAALARTGASAAIFHGLATLPVLAWLALLRPGVARIAVHHGPPGQAETFAGRVVAQLDAMLSHAMVAVSDALFGELASVAGGRPAVRVIENGVDVAWWSGAASRGVRSGGEAGRLAMVGTFTAQKDQQTVLRAVGTLRGEGRDVRLTFAGDGPTRRRCEALAAGLALGGAVRFAGALSPGGVRELLADSDVCVQMSHREGMPMAVLEAMASGAAVVAGDLPGTRAVIEPGRTGVLVPPGDERALARAVGELLDDEPRRVRLGQAAREAASRRFDARRMAGQYESLARQVARQRAVGA